MTIWRLVVINVTISISEIINMDYIEKLTLSALMFLGGGLLIACRRYNNKDHDAGVAISGWTLLIVIGIVFGDSIVGLFK